MFLSVNTKLCKQIHFSPSIKIPKEIFLKAWQFTLQFIWKNGEERKVRDF